MGMPRRHGFCSRLDFRPFLGGRRDRGYVTNLPTCGPPRRQGLCSHLAEIKKYETTQATHGGLAWRRRQIVVVNSDDPKELHWFVCAMNCPCQYGPSKCGFGTHHQGGVACSNPTPPPPFHPPQRPNFSTLAICNLRFRGKALEKFFGLLRGKYFYPMCLCSKYSEFCGEFKISKKHKRQFDPQPDL